MCPIGHPKPQPLVQAEWGITDIAGGSVVVSPSAREDGCAVLHCKPPVGYIAKAATAYLKGHPLATVSKEFLLSCRVLLASRLEPRPDITQQVQRCFVAQQCVHLGIGVLKWRFR